MIRAFVLDDEPLAVRRLERMLRDSGRVEIAGIATDPVEAVAWLTANQVDVLFIDIQMPEMNGFETLALLDPQPLVVFTTAFDQYALKAFEVNSIDYLLKPIEQQHLARALDKLLRLTAGGERQPSFEALAALLAQGYPERIASRVGERLQYLEVGRITHFFAQDKLTYAAIAGKSYAVSYTISQLEQKLNPKQFCRIHRATLVNLAWVAELDAWYLRLKDEARTELQVSRDRATELKKKLGL